MTKHITDEELAKMASWADPNGQELHGQTSDCPWCAHNYPHLNALGLIAALRAARAERDCYRVERDQLRAEQDRRNYRVDL